MTLLTAADYAALTGDTVTSAPAALAAVVESQDLIERWLHRQLDTATVTETARVYADYPGGVSGYVYPKRTPVTSITAPPPPATFDHASIRYISGAFVPGLFFTLSPIDPFPRAIVTYVGGYPARGASITDANGDVVTLPSDLAREIAWAAHNILFPDVSVKEGAEVISSGDTRVQYATPRIINGELTTEAKKRLHRYMRRRVVSP